MLSTLRYMLPQRALWMGCSRSATQNRTLIQRRFLSEKSKRSGGEAKEKQVEAKDLERPALPPRSPVTWKSALITLGLGGVLVYGVWSMKRAKELEREKERYRALGKSSIGGPWELTDHDGKPVSSKDYLGQWYLIYFGFTHCPDVCPDELEKLVKVMNKVNADSTSPNIAGLFFTVDPERDSKEIIKAYLADFSPNLRGFTGTKEQVEKVCRTFRVYHSEGTRDKNNDYIVDHTIIIYLIDPDGRFLDYFGQNKTVEDMVNIIQLQMVKYDRLKKQGII